MQVNKHLIFMIFSIFHRIVGERGASLEDDSSQGGLGVLTVFHYLFVGVPTYYRNVDGIFFV